MIEKPKDKGEIPSCKDPTRYQVDRSDEVVVGGTIERVVKARIVSRMPNEQWDHARDVKSTRGVPWQQTSDETTGGERVHAAFVASVRSDRPRRS